ncbi:MAG: hypothetical protein KC912_14285 [Proteobacteria bacterium]|nr:hypothetical protein [Pseudomonadota bacterium]
MHRILPVFLLLAGCPKKPVETVIASPQDLTLEVLNQWVEEVCELIEEEAGAEFTTTPHVREATRPELTQVVIEEAVLMTLAQYPELSERAVRDQLSGTSVQGILGKYGILTAVMYVDVDAIWQLAEESHGGAEGVPAVAKVLLAHELVHALQDQAANSGDVWDKLPDADAFEAYRSVTEGQASWVERRVAARLGHDDVAETMIEMQGWSFEEGPKHPAAFTIWSAYGAGDVFMQGLYDRGGHALQWQAVSEPPPRSSMIFAPTTYEPAPLLAPVGVKKRFAGLETKLGQGTWMALEGRIGEVHLREMLFEHGEAALPLIRSVEEGWRREATLPDRVARFSELWFADSEAADAFVDFLASGAESDQWQVDALDYGDAGVKITRAPGMSEGGSRASNEERIFVVRIGAKVLMLNAVAFRPGRRADEVLGAMLARMEET